MLRNTPQKPNSPYSLTKGLQAFIIRRSKNTAETAPAGDHKHLDVQVLMGEVESLLDSMDQGDARVQRIVAKVHELKTAVLLTEQKE